MCGPAPIRCTIISDALRHTTAGVEENTGMCEWLHLFFKYPTNLVGFTNKAKIFLQTAIPGDKNTWLPYCVVLVIENI
jgi:hypothetical protein